MTIPATTAWFAAHELRLAWRDWLAMLTGGKRSRSYIAAVGMIGFVLFMHAMALLGLRNVPDIGASPSKTALVFISGSALLAFALMISQSMESVTRAFYTRSDLDLILSSPASARRPAAIASGRPDPYRGPRQSSKPTNTAASSTGLRRDTTAFAGKLSSG